MNLRLYNTLNRTKEDFTPLDPKNVRLYVCGPTVYDFAHIGNARPVIVFDVLFRLLRHLYGEAHVNYVRNITDIDDKINARAAAEGVSIRDVTEKTARQYLDDVTALGCLPPTHTPRATEHIPEMIAMIAQLIDAGFAYPAEGHVLFDVGKKKDYGKLARRSLDEMIAGARVDVAPYKKNPMDFVLWKPSDAATPGWDSPWGRGRPGWHIECSAMSETLLGETFDIHGGGIDLVFPHHENEIAQSEGAHGGHPLARYWMHNGFLNVEGEKMSKSLGNFVTIRELLNTKTFGGKSWTGGVLRFAMLKTHYRQPIDWTLNSLEEANVELATWANAISNSGYVGRLIGRDGLGLPPNPPSEIIEALVDDLNTPNMFTIMREFFTRYTQGSAQAGLDLAEACDFLGLLKLDKLFVYNPYHVGSGPKLLPPNFKVDLREVQVAYANSNSDRVRLLTGRLLTQGVRVTVRSDGGLEYEVVGPMNAIDKNSIERAIEARKIARKAKDFKESDRIRDELLAQGIVLKDSPDGTTWEVKR